MLNRIRHAARQLPSWLIFDVGQRMTYYSRIPADPEYLQALGRAVYNFTYFEWSVVWTIVKLSSDGFDSVPKGKPALEIAKALTSAIEKTKPPLSGVLRRQLVKIDESY